MELRKKITYIMNRGEYDGLSLASKLEIIRKEKKKMNEELSIIVLVLKKKCDPAYPDIFQAARELLGE